MRKWRKVAAVKESLGIVSPLLVFLARARFVLTFGGAEGFFSVSIVAPSFRASIVTNEL